MPVCVGRVTWSVCVTQSDFTNILGKSGLEELGADVSEKCPSDDLGNLAGWSCSFVGIRM